MKTKKSILVLISVLCFISCSKNNKPEQQKSTELEQVPTTEEVSRVYVEYIGSGVSILTIDNHDYVHYRDDNNAASTGGIVHKADCRYCAEHSLK